ncbi:hypothetical protein Tco_0236985 [Tanacetum coccineum]
MITNSKLEIGDEFLKILQDNAFNGMNGGDVTNHIARVLEITEWIKMPKVEKNELRLHVFSKSLSGDAETCTSTKSGFGHTWAKWNGHTFTYLCDQSSVHPINLEDNIEQRGQDSTNETMETLPNDVVEDCQGVLGCLWGETLRDLAISVLEGVVWCSMYSPCGMTSLVLKGLNDSAYSFGTGLGLRAGSVGERCVGWVLGGRVLRCPPGRPLPLISGLGSTRTPGWYSVLIDHLIRRIHQLDTTYQTSCSGQRIEFYSLNGVYVLRQYDEIIRRKGIAMATLDLNGTNNTPCLSNLNYAEPETNDSTKIEISKELLMELRSSAYNGAEANDVVDHITRFLQIIDLVKIPNVNTEQLCLFAFPYSLSGGACRSWMHEGNDRITSWVELVDKFFYKYCPLSRASRTIDTNGDSECHQRFMHWLNAKFKNPWKLNTATKNALWNF